MSDKLSKYCSNLPIELVKHILKYKTFNKCIICKQYFSYNFYVKFLKRDLCSYKCYLSYFYGYKLYSYIIILHFLLTPFLFMDILFFKYYYLFVVISFSYLYIEQFFFVCM